jgi:peptide/nickel transport system substrate-binding protein
MNVKQREAISTSATVAIIVIILVIAGVAAYFVLVPTTTPTTTTTTSQQTTTTTTTSQQTTTTTTTTSALYGPTNSSVLVDESQGVAYDSLDPQYAFYLQDVAMLNAVYQNLVELNGTQGNVFQPVLADSYNVNLNNGATTSFHIRSGVWFSNGDKFTSYDVWFTIVRNLLMNAPSGIAPFNWNQILYNNNAGGSEYSDSYCWNNAGIGLPAGLADAVQSVTGGYKNGTAYNAETVPSCNLAADAVANMLSNFNPSNSTQAAIMAYSNQAVVAPNATTFVANYLHPLGAFALELWSGFDGQNVVDPAFIDAHGGVVPNQLNSYINLNGAIGTGPYMIKSVGAGLAPVTFVATPNYWGASNPAITGNKSMTDAAPAKIPVVIYNVAPSDTALIEDFATNKAQLSFESIQEYGQMYSAFHANHPSFTFADIHKAVGAFPFGSWFLMNTVSIPTNITAFRLGWEHAINYTELNAPNYFNGTAYATYFVGALTPAFGSLYNPDNYSPPAYNTTLAFNYFQQAGMEGHYYTVVPSTFTLSNGTTVKSGTVIGDPNGQQLQPLKLYYTVPLLSELKGQLQGIQQNLGLFGINAVPYGITSAESNILTSNAQTFPQVEILGWGPDYADPFLAMYEPLLLPSPYNGWFTNQTVINEVNACDFAVGAQVQTCAQTLEQMVVQNGLFPPFPNIPYYYFFVQPYVQGFVNNGFVGYWYNQIYYTPVPT